MVKLWIKVYKHDKIIKQTVVEKDEKFYYSKFPEYLSEGCYALDEATPVVLKNHIMNFAKYHMTVFKPSDFIESFNYDRMTVEILDR